MEPVHLPIKPKHKSSIKQKNNLTNLESLREIISLTSGKNPKIKKSDATNWRPTLVDLFSLLCSNTEIGNDAILLTSNAFLSLEKAVSSTTEFENELYNYFKLEKNQITKYNRLYEVYNVDLFKLIICSGLLQVGDSTKSSKEIYKIIFEIAYPHCIRYTGYTYFAFKIMQSWMQRSSKTHLWSGNSFELEGQLESVIFSNWDNSICKANVVGLFAAYLDVMKNKYDGFLQFLFSSCVENISWCHVTKYTILAAICSGLEDINLMTDSQFISALYNSLTLNHLSSASSKVYTIICNKLTKDVWQATFGAHVKNFVITWETEKKYATLQTLCKCWLEPVIKRHRDIVPFLAECCDDDCILYKSHLLRIAKKYVVTLPITYDNQVLLDHEDEFVRLNAFAAHCHEVGISSNDQYFNSVNAIKHFLYFNAIADTTYLREGSFNYFKIFLSNFLKRSSVQKDSKDLVRFLDWFHEFLLDCFEIGSCYQRKIFGLHLYKITLQLLCSDNVANGILSKNPNFKEAMKYSPVLRKEMTDLGKWKFHNKESIVLLFKLILDPANDIQEISSSIIIDYFEPNILSDAEKSDIFITALNKCNSCKFFETASGAYLFKVLTKWFVLNSANKTNLKPKINMKIQSLIKESPSYVRFLYREAVHQLIQVKHDVLKAATKNTPFYGVVTAIVMTGFVNGPERQLMTETFLKEVMTLCEDATNYFLLAFSSKSSNPEYSSSFQEMGLAIDEAVKGSEINYEYDELVLSPAQQIVITCIWRSLKVLCELLVEIAKSELATKSMIVRATELIVTVSLKCRHKGVIESAGASMANLTRHLSKDQQHAELLLDQLKKLLNNDFSSSINLTRRGAGLTILFHKLIASDTRADRPLLHYAVNFLMQKLRDSALIKVEQRESSNYDDPCAMHLHFLKTLVADKQLQPQMSSYVENICLTCFEYIPSRVFTIRNASVQLFGAIVSRLVGQNIGAKSVDFGYGYSINYFATHFPQLAAHILLNLQACCQPIGAKYVKWQVSKNIIHILSLLSMMFFSGCELVDRASELYVKQIRNCLQFYMSSPISHVRNLAAKSYTALVGLSSIEQEIDQLKSQIASTSNFNRLNGYLTALQYLFDKQNDEVQSVVVKHAKMKSLSEVRKKLETHAKIEALWTFWTRRAMFIQQKKLCYTVEAQLLRMSRQFKLVLEENYSIDSKKKNNFDTIFDKNRPGFFEFIDELMQLFVEYISCNIVGAEIKTILEAKCIDFGINFLKYAPRHKRNLLMICVNFAINNFEKVHPVFLEAINIYTNESIKCTFKNQTFHFKYMDISRLKIFASKLENTYTRTIHLSELLLFIHVMSMRGSETYDLFEDFVSSITNEKVVLSNYFNYPEVTRQLIAKGLELLLCNFDQLNTKCRVMPLLVSLVAMKDEVFNIREMIRSSVLDVILTCKLRTRRIFDQIIYFVILENIVSEKTIIGELCDIEINKFFGKYLSTVQQRSSTFDITNPFDDNNVSPYREESKIINYIVFFIKQKFVKTICNKDVFYEIIIDNIFDTKRNLLTKMNIHTDNLVHILSIRDEEYLANKLKIVNERYSTIK
ncbi:uncharacterized protein LOC131668955 [Phymastichus coffea]|uniref:uncharacterized protein LOC131668955 n=1 Tax=Phymastichus coffea TaxID=108790 RepID=UPI00273C7BAA|nr:uncharacterized protein LOC131668955 [Phymastichus coffea]